MNQKEPHLNKLLNITEAATYLGLKVNTLYSWSSQRRITNIKIGRRLMFRQK